MDTKNTRITLVALQFFVLWSHIKKEIRKDETQNCNVQGDDMYKWKLGQ